MYRGSAVYPYVQAAGSSDPTEQAYQAVRCHLEKTYGIHRQGLSFRPYPYIILPG
jgi:hypothetical protein